MVAATNVRAHDKPFSNPSVATNVHVARFVRGAREHATHPGRSQTVPAISPDARELHPVEPKAVARRTLPPSDVRAGRVPPPQGAHVRGDRQAGVPLRDGLGVRRLRAAPGVRTGTRVAHGRARADPVDVTTSRPRAPDRGGSATAGAAETGAPDGIGMQRSTGGPPAQGLPCAARRPSAPRT